MPTSQERRLAVVAIAKDILHALHIPGGETLGELVQKKINERNEDTFKTLIKELEKGQEEGIVFEENDVDDFVQMVLRLRDAVSKGTARRNLSLIAQVIVGLKRNRLFQIDNFQRWASVLETLTRDEILVLGAAYRLLQREGDTWSLLKSELVPTTFATNRELEAICASLMRTGLMIPASGFGALTYRFSEAIKQLGALAELELSART